MFLLTTNRNGERTVKGIFPSIHMAKKFVDRVMRREHLQWSEPSNVSGAISADLGDGYIEIKPVGLDPKT